MTPILRTGSKGPEVGNWQRFLAANGYVDSQGVALKIDENFGWNTFWATKSYQIVEHLSVTGEVDTVTRTLAQLHGFIPFVQAQNCTLLFPASRPSPRLVVIHTAEAPEKPNVAMNVAYWFAGERGPAPQASAHYTIDDRDIVQCVRDGDVAWAAPGANRNGVHLEHAGFASQTPVAWDDEYSQAVLEKSAELAAVLATKYNIPIVKLSPEDLAAGKTGFCGHVDVTKGLNGGKGHVDPGQSFPWGLYLARVRALAQEK